MFNRILPTGDIHRINTAGLNFLHLYTYGTVEFRYSSSTFNYEKIKRMFNLYLSLVEEKDIDKIKDQCNN
jgi:hypothetical protein